MKHGGFAHHIDDSDIVEVFHGVWKERIKIADVELIMTPSKLYELREAISAYIKKRTVKRGASST